MRHEIEHISEQLLTARLLSGDPAARALLYDRYAGALYGVILHIVPVKETAADILVRTYSRVFHQMEAYRQSGYRTLFAWLMREARLFALREALPETVLTDVALIDREKSLITTFCQLLPNQLQQVFRLRYFKGLSVTTIARVLALTEQEVHEMLGAAMKAFRKFIKNNWS